MTANPTRVPSTWYIFQELYTQLLRMHSCAGIIEPTRQVGSAYPPAVLHTRLWGQPTWN